MQALIGEYSVNRLKWSAAASRLERARRGWPHSGSLPWGRKVAPSKDRRNQDAEWFLIPECKHIAEVVFDAYVKHGKTFGEVSKQLGMNPETLRRIVFEQGGDVWHRSFRDPVTGKIVEIQTKIPALYNDEQLRDLALRAKRNQQDRAKSARGVREYPLSGYLRCANPECGWSNLSGHRSADRRRKTLGVDEPQKAWAYYRHVIRCRCTDGCMPAVPAELIEDEVFARIGQLLANASDLESAVQSALDADSVDASALRQELANIEKQKSAAERTLKNALDVLYEHKGTAAGASADHKVREQNRLLENLSVRIDEIRRAIDSADIPKDFPQRFSLAMHRLTGLHGMIPMHWPTDAKRRLLQIFFAGAKSTRFDRESKGRRSGLRGIFVSRVLDDHARPLWVYEIRGLIGALRGALTTPD